MAYTSSGVRQREHSAILTSHRGPLYNGGKLLPTSFERTHPWDVLRLSPSPKFVQANNGTRFANSSTHALTNGSIPSNSSSMNPHPPFPLRDPGGPGAGHGCHHPCVRAGICAVARG